MVNDREKFCRWCNAARLEPAVGVLISHKYDGGDVVRVPLCRFHARTYRRALGEFVPFTTTDAATKTAA